MKKKKKKRFYFKTHHTIPNFTIFLESDCRDTHEYAIKVGVN